MELTRNYLHKIEMDLVNLCEDKREAIINYFTDIMGDVRE